MLRSLAPFLLLLPISATAETLSQLSAFCDFMTPPNHLSEVECNIVVELPPPPPDPGNGGGGVLALPGTGIRAIDNPTQIDFAICNEWDPANSRTDREVVTTEIDVLSGQPDNAKAILVFSNVRITGRSYLVLDWLPREPTGATHANGSVKTPDSPVAVLPMASCSKSQTQVQVVAKGTTVSVLVGGKFSVDLPVEGDDGARVRQIRHGAISTDFSDVSKIRSVWRWRIDGLPSS